MACEFSGSLLNFDCIENKMVVCYDNNKLIVIFRKEFHAKLNVTKLNILIKLSKSRVI